LQNKHFIMNEEPKFAVIGGGSWATAIAKMLCHNLEEIAWYMRNDSAIEEILENHHNPNYLSSVEFDTNQLRLTSDINEAIAFADYLIFAVPSAFLGHELEKLTIDISDKIIISAIKGIIPESGLIVGEHFCQTYRIPRENICVIAGPCHAEEVALERLSYITIAGIDLPKAEIVADCLKSHYIKTKVSDDVFGAEYTSMLKNIYAVACGMAHGLGYGDNFQAVLMSNAIREMKRFIKKVHRMKRNINDSAYLGDLLVTGYSLFSRNRMFGNMIGKGYTVKSAQMEMNMVAEGYYATRSAYIMNTDLKAKTPIIDAVYDVLYNGKEPKKVFKKLTEKLD